MPEKHRSTKRYPPELKERAVRMVQETIENNGEQFGVVSRVARQLGIGEESLRAWFKQAQVDGGPAARGDDRREASDRRNTHGAPSSATWAWAAS
jgi:transposase-like protein